MCKDVASNCYLGIQLQGLMNITNPVTHCSILLTVAGIQNCTFRNKSLNFTAEEVSWSLPLWFETREARKKRVLKMKVY
jgi:hypothetical protein